MSSGIASDLPRSPQRQRGRERVAALMTAGSAVFLEKGYDATTMTEIAARAGASIGSLYLFFPTKPVIAAAIVAELSDGLSQRLDALQARSRGWAAAALADALFAELFLFLADHPVYAALIDVPGDTNWRQTVRARRRMQIAALFAQADPTLPPGQADRLAIIVPQMMRIIMTTSGETPDLQAGVREEIRAMLRHYLE